MVFPPIRESFFKSESEATPVMREAKTRGTAINFNKLIKIVPKGATQCVVKSPHPNVALRIPYPNPRTSPIIIFQCNGRFFIVISLYL